LGEGGSAAAGKVSAAAGRDSAAADKGSAAVGKGLGAAGKGLGEGGSATATAEGETEDVSGVEMMAAVTMEANTAEAAARAVGKAVPTDRASLSYRSQRNPY
jgi:hypothetical protein